MAPQVEIRKNPEAANEGDVLREQLEYLIGHREGTATCACPECQRYVRVRAILLEIFALPPRAKVQDIDRHLPKAA